jgi:hypothetical protein
MMMMMMVIIIINSLLLKFQIPKALTIRSSVIKQLKANILIPYIFLMFFAVPTTKYTSCILNLFAFRNKRNYPSILCKSMIQI